MIDWINVTPFLCSFISRFFLLVVFLFPFPLFLSFYLLQNHEIQCQQVTLYYMLIRYRYQPLNHHHAKTNT